MKNILSVKDQDRQDKPSLFFLWWECDHGREHSWEEHTEMALLKKTLESHIIVMLNWKWRGMVILDNQLRECIPRRPMLCLIIRKIFICNKMYKIHPWFSFYLSTKFHEILSHRFFVILLIVTQADTCVTESTSSVVKELKQERVTKAQSPITRHRQLLYQWTEFTQ